MKKVAKKLTKLNVAPMLKDSAQQIWLAGLGAFALAGEEGNKLFKTLVRRGEGVEKGIEKLGKSRLDKVMDQATSLRADARQALGRLRRPLDNGMATALHRIGVPTHSEILALTKRVEALTHAVEKGKNGKRAARRRTRRAAEPATSQG
jgi:poly(hydroxyalkanoate) granule-associated protein